MALRFRYRRDHLLDALPNVTFMSIRNGKDQYGFKFWLGWIVQFAGSFIAAVLFWTFSLTALFGGIRGAEISITWAVAVFGSWFILMIPFMRKKERIWKRLNDDQEKATDAWLLGLRIFHRGLEFYCRIFPQSDIQAPDKKRLPFATRLGFP